MKTALKLVLCLYLLASPSFAASNLEDYQIVARALESSIPRFKKAMEAPPAYDVVLRRDPMLPLTDKNGRVIYAPGLHEGMMVQGIIRAGDDREVLVDDEFYREGETIGSYLIQEIHHHGISVLHVDQVLFVPLYPDTEPVHDPAPRLSR